MELSVPITLATGVLLMPIPSSPNGDYMAGSDGQVYSRTKYKGFGRKEYVDWYPLKGHRTAKGYFSVSMSHENKKVTKAVHRLVCEAFHGAPPSPTHQVRHLDGNGLNNRPTNLCWGTQIENWQDRQAHGHGIKGEKHHAAKFSNFERKALRWAIGQGLCSQRHAARVLGVTQSSVSEIVLGSED
jgi:hypothetical protein